MIAKITATCLVSLVFAVPAFAQGNNPGNTQGNNGQMQASQQTQQFLSHQAAVNQGEIVMGMLAEKQAANPAVKAFARLMVDDHMMLESQLAEVAGELHVPLTEGVTQTDRQAMQQLAPMSGHPFDMRYMRDNVTGHEQAIRGVEQELQQTHNPAIRGLIMGGLPILEQHLALAEAVDNAIGGSGGAQAMNQAG